MVSWTAAPCWTDSMRRTRVNAPSCGEVQKTRYGPDVPAAERSRRMRVVIEARWAKAKKRKRT
jgi:hypothetical protein